MPEWHDSRLPKAGSFPGKFFDQQTTWEVRSCWGSYIKRWSKKQRSEVAARFRALHKA